MKTWYEGLAILPWLKYGPSFRRIQKLTTSTKQMLAAATLSNSSEVQNFHTPFHAVTIDASFQVRLAASTKGLCRNFTEPQVPVVMEELEVWHSTTNNIICAASCSETGGELSVDDVGSDGKPCLRVRTLKLKALGDDGHPSQENTHGAARLEWVADYDFQDVSSLVKVPSSHNFEKKIIEELVLLCIVESAELLKHSMPSVPHLLKYRDWLERVAHEALANQHPLLKNTERLVSVSAEERQRKMERGCEEASSSPLMTSWVEGIMRIRKNIQGLFTGEADALELLPQENNLARIYDTVSFDYSDFICTFSATVPNLRVLENGAGTGGITELILRGMQQPVSTICQIHPY
jgi:hypothetical protein